MQHVKVEVKVAAPPEHSIADPVLKTIQKLAHEEHELRAREGRMDASVTDVQRLQELEVALDQCWDLLRQRRALKGAGLDAGLAATRPVVVVEGYEQ